MSEDEEDFSKLLEKTLYEILESENCSEPPFDEIREMILESIVPIDGDSTDVAVLNKTLKKFIEDKDRELEELEQIREAVRRLLNRGNIGEN